MTAREQLCLAAAPFTGWMSGVVVRCALPKNHEGPHAATYGKQWEDKQ